MWTKRANEECKVVAEKRSVPAYGVLSHRKSNSLAALAVFPTIGLFLFLDLSPGAMPKVAYFFLRVL